MLGGRASRAIGDNMKAMVIAVIAFLVLSCDPAIDVNSIRFVTGKVYHLRAHFIESEYSETAKTTFEYSHRESAIYLEKEKKVLVIDEYGFPDSEFTKMNLSLLDWLGKEKRKVKLNNAAYTIEILEDVKLIIFIENDYVEIFNTDLHKISETNTNIRDSYYFWSKVTEDKKYLLMISSETPNTIIDFQEENSFFVHLIGLSNKSYIQQKIGNEQNVIEYNGARYSLDTDIWKK